MSNWRPRSAWRRASAFTPSRQKLAADRGLDPLLQINLTATPERYYPEKTLASQIVGMLALERDGSWLTGYYGLEGYYDNFLRQRDGIGLTAKSTGNADRPARKMCSAFCRRWRAKTWC